MAEPKPRPAMDHNRACDPCRTHKVRCFPDSSLFISQICQRCARTDRNCVYTAPQRRKQRKRTDTRVAELEREVQAMRSLFEGKEDKFQATPKGQPPTIPRTSVQQKTSESACGSTPISKTIASSGSFPSYEYNSAPEANAQQDEPLPAMSDSEWLDVVDRGIISFDLAEELFNTYVTDLVPHYPAVAFAPGVSAAEIRKKTPILFLAIIAAASGKSNPHLYSVLNSEVITVYAQKTVIESQKSLELVQAMIVTAIWYYPPGKFSQLKFYEYIHMAAFMALDIGLGKNPKTLRRRRGVESQSQGLIDDDSGKPESYEEIERRRTFLACYLITTGVSMSMRRRAMLRSNTWLSDCVESLEKSPLAVTTDKMLIAWVRLMCITEELSASLSFDDPGNMPSLTEPRIQLMLKSFEKKLDIWRDGMEPAEREDNALVLAYHQNKIFLHEVALHEDHPPEDFLPPFTIDQVLLPTSQRRMTSSHVEAISVCVSSAHSLLERVLGMTVESLRALPIFNFVRVAYAAIILTKLYVSVRSESSQIGKFIDRETLRVSSSNLRN